MGVHVQGGGRTTQGEVHAAPDRDRGPTPDYTHEQLRRLPQRLLTSP
jgi:hypothetical protein